VVPGLDEPPERVAALTPRFSWTVFWSIIATGCVWPLLLVVAVDSYLETGRLQVFLAVYSDSPGLYLLLFLSQALWSALPFVAFAVLAQSIYESSRCAGFRSSPGANTSRRRAGLSALRLRWGFLRS